MLGTEISKGKKGDKTKMDIKCKLCKTSFTAEEELNTHWEGQHKEEWRKLQEYLKGMDRKEQTHLEVSNEGMKTLARGR